MIPPCINGTEFFVECFKTRTGVNQLGVAASFFSSVGLNVRLAGACVSSDGLVSPSGAAKHTTNSINNYFVRTSETIRKQITRRLLSMPRVEGVTSAQMMQKKQPQQKSVVVNNDKSEDTS